jgi:hypothetical protein
MLRGTDQLINSASSALFGLGSVFLLSATEFGGLSLQLVVFSIVLGLLRSSVFEAALFTRADVDTRGFSWVMPRAGVIAGAFTAVLVVVVGALIPDYGQSQSVAVAVVTLSVLAADGVRYGAIASGKAFGAIVCDSVWLFSTIAGWLALSMTGNFTFESLACTYAVSALVGLVVGRLMIHRALGDVERLPLSHLRRQQLFGADFMLQVVPGQLVLVVAPFVIGLDGLGLYRAVVTLFQPLLTTATALRLAVLDGQRSERRLAETFGKTVYVLLAASVAYTVLALVGTQVVPILDRGALTSVSAVLVGVYGAAEVVRVGSQPWFDVARLRDRLRPLVSIRTLQAVLIVACSLAFGAMIGTNGYAIARLLTALAGAVAIWLVLDESRAKSPMLNWRRQRPPRSTS